MTMLDDLVARGLDPLRSYLFVIDGSCALRRALSDVFGKRAVVQRCQIHKQRNVIGHLPKHLHATTKSLLRQADELKNPNTAKKRLRAFARSIEDEHPSAARSLREGLDETLTVQSLGLSAALTRTSRSHWRHRKPQRRRSRHHKTRQTLARRQHDSTAAT